MEIADLGQRIGGSGRPFIGPSGEIAGSVTDHISIHAPLSACVRLVNVLRDPGLAPAATTIVNGGPGSAPLGPPTAWSLLRRLFGLCPS